MKITRNSAIEKMSGTMDGWTYRTRTDGVTSAYRANPPDTPPTRAQEKRRDLFKEAQAYARRVMADPLRRTLYQRLARERKKPTNTLLVSNYLKPPQIELVECENYRGQPGQQIRVLARDLIEVVSVKVAIRCRDGAMVETGDAVSDHGVWTYTTTVAAPPAVEWQIEIVAANRAERTATATVAQPGGANGADATPVP